MMGTLVYGACIFRCNRDSDGNYIEPTHDQMVANSHTALRRFEIRPVWMLVDSVLDYSQLMTTIRGALFTNGVKGPRTKTRCPGARIPLSQHNNDGGDSETDTSSNEYLSEHSSADGYDDMANYPAQCEWEQSNGDGHTWESCATRAKRFDSLDHYGACEQCMETANECELTGDYTLDRSVHESVKLGVHRWSMRRIRYIHETDGETYQGEKCTVRRDYFITAKANTQTGALIYGASISRRRADDTPMTETMVEAHYKTAMSRLYKCPVYMVISHDLLYQLELDAPNCEDIMYEIVDRINDRRDGMLQIRGGRLNNRCQASAPKHTHF
jgi:hypothetical protein